MPKIISIEHIYPKTCKWIKENIPLLEIKKPKIWKAYLKYSQLKKADASQSLKNGWGPEILLDELWPANGKYRPEVNRNAIFIAENIFRMFENKESKNPKMHRVLESTILHEMCHWGDLKFDGKQQRLANGKKFEEGKAFEKEAYGKNIDPFWDGQYLARTVYEQERMKAK